MEAVKTALASALAKEFGPGCIMELDTKDRCMKIELPSIISRDHVIYVRPDDYERHFLCQYAHKADMSELLCEPNGDVRAWKQRNVSQLVRRVKGVFPREFVKAAMWYAKQAAERIERMKGLGGRRGDFPLVETFAEAGAREYDDREPGVGAGDVMESILAANNNNHNNNEGGGGGEEKKKRKQHKEQETKKKMNYNDDDLLGGNDNNNKKKQKKQEKFPTKK
jgi:hypothetical protein